MVRAARASRSHRPVKVGVRLNAVHRPRRARPKGVRVVGGRRPYQHHPISAAARARRIGKPHPHKGYHGPRRAHHLSAAALARRIGKKHPHRGHALSAATRAKISAALKGRKHPHRRVVRH